MRTGLHEAKTNLQKEISLPFCFVILSEDSVLESSQHVVLIRRSDDCEGSKGKGTITLNVYC